MQHLTQVWKGRWQLLLESSNSLRQLSQILQSLEAHQSLHYACSNIVVLKQPIAGRFISIPQVLARQVSSQFDFKLSPLGHYAFGSPPKRKKSEQHNIANCLKQSSRKCFVMRDDTRGRCHHRQQMKAQRNFWNNLWLEKKKTLGSEAAAAAWSADVAEAMRDGRRQRHCRDAVTAARCALASGAALSAASVQAHQHRPYPATMPNKPASTSINDT